MCTRVLPLVLSPLYCYQQQQYYWQDCQPACLRACLPACLICRAQWGWRRAENTVQQDQPELVIRTKKKYQISTDPLSENNRYLLTYLPATKARITGRKGGKGYSSCGDCCPLCLTGVGTRGKFVLSSPRVVNGHRRHVPGAPSSDTPRESQAKFRDGTVCGLYTGPVGNGPVGWVFGENSFYRNTWGTGRGESPCG